MLKLTIKEGDSAIVTTPSGQILRVTFIGFHHDDRRKAKLGFDGDREAFAITREKAKEGPQK